MKLVVQKNQFFFDVTIYVQKVISTNPFLGNQTYRFNNMKIRKISPFSAGEK